VADFLRAMAIASTRRARRARVLVPASEMRKRAADVLPAPQLQLSEAGFDVIAEVKRRAPGRPNPIHTGPRDMEFPTRLATAYAQAGAAAVSVLTEPLAFDGGLDDLARVVETLNELGSAVPAMRKDFLVDPYQLFEARAAGAGGALLIADMLDLEAIDPMLDAAEESGLWLLIEAFADARFLAAIDMARQARERGVIALVGVNTRDLRSLTVDADRLRRVAAIIPDDIPVVAESGLHDEADAAGASRLGYRLALVGTALVAASDPAARLSGLIQAGRSATGENK